MTAPKTVLIIDDDPDYVTAVSALLTDAGYAVHSAANGADGLRLARSLLPDIVLLDVIMTDRTEGFTILRQMRAVPALAATPVVIVSSLYTSELPVFQVGAEAGWVPADLILPKPVDPKRLLSEVTRLIKST
jgi:two-component system alkaline phosphatase synthesis response regulator PhoP